MSWLNPKKPQTPTPPTKADASIITAGNQATAGMGSMISTGAQGLKRKASTNKPSLIGGS